MFSAEKLWVAAFNSDNLNFLKPIVEMTYILHCLDHDKRETVV